MSFAVPEALLLLVAVAGAGALCWLAVRWKRRVLAALALSSAPELLVHLGTPGRQAVKVGLVLLGLAMLVLALGRPHLGVAPPPPPALGNGDLIVLLDVSLSMATQDAAPSRLGAAKAQISGLLSRLQGERVGLVVFAGSPALRFPLTRDYEAAGTLVQAADIDSAPSPGSSYPDGLRAALRALGQSDAQLKTILLLGDGETLSGDLEAAALEAATQNISVQAVGIGSPEGGTIPVANPNGSPAVKRDAAGQIVVSRLQEDGLRALADHTGGAYRRGSAGGRELQQLYESVAQRSAGDAERPNLPAADLTPYFVLLAFVLLTAEWLVPERGTTRIPATAALPVALLLLTGCSITSVAAFDLNEEGIHLYQDGRFNEALDRFRRAQVQQPHVPELNLNAGAGLYQTDDLERSIKETQQTLNAEAPEVRAAAHYNMGGSYFRLGRFQDAFEEYKKALRETPDDLDAKTNLELALYHLRQQPPAQSQEDQQQPGNQSQQPGQPNASSQGGRGPNNPDGSDFSNALRRAMQQAGPDMSIEDALRVLDVLRDREAQNQRRYNQAPRSAQTPARPEKDW